MAQRGAWISIRKDPARKSEAQPAPPTFVPAPPVVPKPPTSTNFLSNSFKDDSASKRRPEPLPPLVSPPKKSKADPGYIGVLESSSQEDSAPIVPPVPGVRVIGDVEFDDNDSFPDDDPPPAAQRTQTAPSTPPRSGSSPKFIIREQVPVQATRGKSRRATRHSGGFRSDLASAVPEDDIEEDGEDAIMNEAAVEKVRSERHNERQGEHDIESSGDEAVPSSGLPPMLKPLASLSKQRETLHAATATLDTQGSLDTRSGRAPYVLGGLASRARALALRSRPRAESGADDLSSTAPSTGDKAPIFAVVLTTANEDGVSQAVCYVEASSPSTPARYLLVLFQRDLPDKPMPGSAFTILSPWDSFSSSAFVHPVIFCWRFVARPGEHDLVQLLQDYAEALPALEQKPFVPIDNSMFNASQRSQSQSRPPSAPRVDDPLPSEIPSDIFSQSLHRTQPDVPVPSLPMPPPTPPAPVFVSRPLVVDIFPAPPVLVAFPLLEGVLIRCFVTTKGEEVLLIKDDIYLLYLHGRLASRPTVQEGHAVSITGLVFKEQISVQSPLARQLLSFLPSARVVLQRYTFTTSSTVTSAPRSAVQPVAASNTALRTLATSPKQFFESVRIESLPGLPGRSMALPIVHLYDPSLAEIPLRSICLSFSSSPNLRGLTPGRTLRLRDAVHCVQTNQFTQMEVFVSDVAPSLQSLPALSMFDELATLQGSAMLHTLCLLRGIVTDVLKSSTLVNCCTLCKSEMAEWFTVEREESDTILYYCTLCARVSPDSHIRWRLALEATSGTFPELGAPQELIGQRIEVAAEVVALPSGLAGCAELSAVGE